MPSLKEYVEKAKKKSLTRKDLAQKLLQKGYTQSEIEEAFSDGKQIHENESLPLGEKIKGLFQPATFFHSSLFMQVLYFSSQDLYLWAILFFTQPLVLS